MAVKRTTIELDEDLVARAKAALQLDTVLATVEEALRQAAERAENEFAERAERQRVALRRMNEMCDLDVLRSNEMWR
ncbi:MAG: type II toxin-antitoxin system VapB family antitoxin [Pseudonocardia sp.]|nr:type II toxin-antitoxin system VapB family antitoxin [Pseudonocardia sp.]